MNKSSPQQTLSRRRYIAGFCMSVLCTTAAYVLAVSHAVPVFVAAAVILALALLQAAVQLVYFLHINSGEDAQARGIVLGFAALIVLIIVSGSVWIMASLNQRMLPSEAQMNQYMNSQQGM